MINIFDRIIGEGKFTLAKAALVGLSIIIPIFLIAAAPSIAWFSIAADKRYDEKYYWLQDFMWIWPVCLVGLGFLGALGYMIYNNLRDTGKIK